MLWTNPSPSSSFASQDVTVSDITAFSFIKIQGKLNTAGTNESIEVIYSPSTILASAISGSVNAPICIMGAFFATNSRYARYVVGKSATVINFSNALRIGGTDDNSRIIPTKIIGIK